MEWLALLQLCLIPILGILTGFLIKFLKAKEKEITDKLDNETLERYIIMLDDTIIACVTATTQTYVEALKKENAFTKEAQEEAFQKTYNAIMAVLTEDAKKYLTQIYGDLNAYITNRIEAEVKAQK